MSGMLGWSGVGMGLLESFPERTDIEMQWITNLSQ